MSHLNKILLLIFLIIALPSNATVTAAPFERLIQSGQYDEAVQLANNHDKLYLNTLLKLAKNKNLHLSKKWHMLIHYKSDMFGNHTSEVDDKSFFMSNSGKHNPETELEATLASFFSDIEGDPIKLTSQCRFIARFHWLNQQLAFNPEKIAIQHCQKFLDYKKGVNAESITLIFPSAHPNGPASMFGHTSLKIDKKSHTQKTRMLDYTLNFAAQAGPDRGFSYAMKGLTGNFRGQYGILPYYSKIREYGQMESRDIWEYTLNLTQEQVDFIIMHSYELSTTYYDYYFFTENCSYHLLTLIESSMDSPILSDNFRGWVIPVDTLKAIEKNNLIKQVQYLPSLSSKIYHLRSKLSQKENDIVYTFFENGLDTSHREYDNLSLERKAMVLDLLYEYTRYYKIDSSNQLDTSISQTERNILMTRSRLSIPSNPLDSPIPEARPDQGHDTSRINFDSVKPDGRPSFQRIAWRSAYHGLLDPTFGYTPNYELEFFNLKFSNEETSNRYKFDQLELLNITSLAPRDPLFKKTSWRFKTGWDNIVRSTNQTDIVFYLDIGGGVTYKKNWLKQSYLYGFIDLELDFGDDRFNKTLVRIGPTIGILTDINNHWKAQLEFQTLLQNDAINSQINEVTFENNITITKTVSLNLKATSSTNISNNTNDKEITIGLKLFH